MICPHCKRALDEALEKIEEKMKAAGSINWSEEDERRVAAIMQNGNGGEHYEVEAREAWNDSFDEGEEHF